jgi:hypothetical protein
MLFFFLLFFLLFCFARGAPLSEKRFCEADGRPFSSSALDRVALEALESGTDGLSPRRHRPCFLFFFLFHFSMNPFM